MIPRVCVVSALYHPALGGLGRQAQLLSERLRKEGVELFVIARKMEVDGRAAFSPSVEVVRVPSLFPKQHILEEISLKNILISVVFSLGCLGVLIRRRRSYDLVHFHGASIPLFVALPFLSWMGKKVVAKVAAAKLGTEAGSLSGRYWGVGDLLARLARNIDAYIAISEEIQEGLLRDGVVPERIHYIPNFIDPYKFYPAAAEGKDRVKERLGIASRTLVLCSSRLVPRKGIEYLLDAWRDTIPGFPDARLLLLGDGPLRNSLEASSARLGISGTARFAGRVDNVPEYLRAADLFVLPSLQEGLPNALLEAMASGAPIVATRIGGVVDIVDDGVDALLVNPEDPKGLAEAIGTMLRNKPMRERFSAAAIRKIADAYCIESRVERYKNLYASL
ncbi:glycosyltransferase family 4 protein [bacterium]|nr:glycosyltransferase family 4 protein [bacterium]